MIAIHQPNFFPWLGIFNRIAAVEKFVFFDHIQAPLGKSWFSRNKILLNGEVKWLTIPIERSNKSYQKIIDVNINYSINITRKHLGTIKQAYGKCKYFNEIFPLIEDLYIKKYNKLSDFNKEYIKLVSKRIGLNVIFQSSSALNLNNFVGNRLVLEICLQLGAQQYISGEGCLEFIDPSEFEKNGIEFYFQRFSHPEYAQINNGSFVSHLSSLDALFNVGFDGFRILISTQSFERLKP